MRPIDADALIKWVQECGAKCQTVCVEKVFETIKDAPTIAPVKWIPCTEKLPEDKKAVYWVCNDNGYQFECRWTNNVYGLGESDRWGWSIFDIPPYTKVVAWMPLPEPCKEKEDE